MLLWFNGAPSLPERKGQKSQAVVSKMTLQNWQQLQP